jgi:glycosyltransferase involved in cell wall biosynthesis
MYSNPVGDESVPSAAVNGALRNPQPETGAIRAALFTDSDAFAGTERHMLDLGRELLAAGTDVSIACPAATPLSTRAERSGIKVIPIEKRGFVDWTAVGILQRNLRAGKINLIHAHNGRTALSAALAVKLEGNGRYVLTQHFLEPSRTGRNGPKALVSSAVHRWISRSAGHIIAISDAVGWGIRNRGECCVGNLSVIPNGIAPPVEPQLVPPSDVRAALGVKADAVLVVCAARLELEKDVRSLISAMPAVIKAAPDAVCVIAGEGSQRDALEALIRELGTGASTRLLGFREDALSLINAADIFALPSLAEPFGLVLIEAMSLGKPVIATKAGGPCEIVEEEATGLLTPPADPSKLGEALIRLISNKPLRVAMGSCGRKRFNEKFTSKRMAEATLQIYRRALRSNPRRFL